MQKQLTTTLILLVFSSLFLILSLLAYGSTSNAVSDRLTNLHPQSAPLYMPSSDSSSEITVATDVYSNSLVTNPPSYIIQENTQLAEEPNKVVYITIDDGPTPSTTPLYLEALKADNVKATFFMIGSKMKNNSALVRDIASEQHVIGNHSYTHNYDSIYKSVYSLEAEITKTQEVISQLAGIQPKIFRAPGGSTKLLRSRGLAAKIHELGYSFFDWNVSAADTDPHGITKAEVIYNIETYSKHLNKVIVLMHDNGRKASPEALPELIQWFKENGYEFRTLNQDIKPIYLNQKIISELRVKG
jgi:peptidoglycan/xylan/chitin deacetylase (PgdA/CDA1 family)